ncbi:hypothetical protein [Paenibacillus sp. HJGM_3]|uniref:hypothetical protein n=1 Tax=Paenibacillus sp. HJGM_3 TaxID=3379816 RepID=UPI00385E7DFA
MFRYAQIDIATGVCIAILATPVEIEELPEHMIPLSEGEFVNPRDTYENRTWVPAPPPEPVPPGETVEQKFARLEADNANLKSQNAEIILTLVMNNLM